MKAKWNFRLIVKHVKPTVSLVRHGRSERTSTKQRLPISASPTTHGSSESGTSGGLLSGNGGLGGGGLVPSGLSDSLSSRSRLIAPSTRYQPAGHVRRRFLRAG